MKNLLLFAFVLLAVVSFGGFDPAFVEYVDNPTNILIFKAYIYNSNLSALSLYSWQGNKDTLPSTVISMARIGIEVHTNSNFPLTHPSGDNELFPSSPSIDYPISRYYDNSRWYCLDYCPDIKQAIQICANLICSGYRSQVLEMFKDQPYGTVICNFRIGDVFHDILTGTNTVFRSQLLSQLSDVNGSLQTLALSLGSVSSDYKTVNNLYLNPSKDNLLDSAANSVTLNGDSGGSQNLTRLYSDSYAGRESEITKALSDLARSQLQAAWLSTLDPESPFYGHNIDGILNDPAKFQKAASQGGGGGGSSLANIMRDVKRLTTNDWASAVTNQLANNTASITNQLAHMFDEGTSMGSALANLQDRSLQTADNTASIDSRLANGITVVVDQGNTSVGVHLDGPVTIEQSQWQSLSSPIGGLSDTLDSLYGDLSTFYNWGDSTTDWSSYFHMMYDFKGQVHSDLSSLSNSFLSVLSVTSSVDRIYDYLSGYQSNSLYQIVSSLTNCIGEYYFTRFRRANEFLDEDELPFSIVDASDSIFGRGFDEGEFSNLNWFSRMELLLFQLQRVNDTTNVLEYSDIEGQLDDSVEGFNSAGTDFVNASRRVVGLFGFITRFADSVKLAFQNSASPSTGGIVLLEGGSWLVDEPLVLNVPVSVQNALRLVFQCIWYLSAAVIAWRIVSSTWDKVITFIRWLWSVFDV